MFVNKLKSYRRILIIFLTPILLLPLAAVGTKEAACAFCLLLMTVYWISEVFPLAVTGFLPVVLFPLFKIMTAQEVASTYTNNVSWLFIGGCTTAIAVEKTMLHKRIALKILIWLGTTPPRLMMGFMLPTYFLSMWISNTAATAMMMPILQGVLLQMDECEKEKLIDEDKVNLNSQEDSVVIHSLDESNKQKLETKIGIDEEISKKKKLFDLGMTLCIPYSASIGGISTLTGSPTNIVLAGQYLEIFPAAPLPLSFGLWFMYNIPISITMLMLGYAWLACYYIGWRELIPIKHGFERKLSGDSSDDAVKYILHKEYKNLGSIHWNEGAALFVFIMMAGLWVFRTPGFMTGWGDLLGDQYAQDGTVAMAATISLFIIPDKRPRLLGGSKDDATTNKAVLSWQDVHEKMPWGLLFLVGGGFALAKGSTKSNLTVWLGSYLKELVVLPSWLICLVVTVASSAFTECTSNVASASIFIPIISQLSIAVGLHPLYLLVPAVEAASLAFMLPVATPSNAIAFQTGRIKVLNMVKAGSIMNILGIAVVFVFINSYGNSLFGLHEFPSWAGTAAINGTNQTKF